MATTISIRSKTNTRRLHDRQRIPCMVRWARAKYSFHHHIHREQQHHHHAHYVCYGQCFSQHDKVIEIFQMFCPDTADTRCADLHHRMVDLWSRKVSLLPGVSAACGVGGQVAWVSDLWFCGVGSSLVVRASSSKPHCFDLCCLCCSGLRRMHCSTRTDVAW